MSRIAFFLAAFTTSINDADAIATKETMRKRHVFGFAKAKANMGRKRRHVHVLTQFGRIRNLTRSLAIENAVTHVVHEVGRSPAQCTDFDNDVADMLQNIAYSPQFRQRMLEIRHLYAHCGQSGISETLKELDNVNSFQKFGDVLSEVFYLHSFFGLPRERFNKQMEMACSRLAHKHITSIEGQSVAQMKRAMLETYDVPELVDDFSFKWSSPRAADQIEHLEDFLIHSFDRNVVGLNWSVCFPNVAVPDLHGMFIHTLLHDIRPYPEPADLVHQPHLFYRALYFVTHLTYFYSGFAIRPVFGPALSPERAFLTKALGLFSAPPTHDNTWNEVDILGEIIDCLLLLGEHDDDPLIQASRQSIAERQHLDGTWGYAHATYNALNGLIKHDWLQPTTPVWRPMSLQSPVTPLEYDTYLREEGWLEIEDG